VLLSPRKESEDKSSEWLEHAIQPFEAFPIMRNAHHVGGNVFAFDNVIVEVWLRGWAATLVFLHRLLLFRFISPELLGEPDEKSFGPANVAQPIRLLVLHHVVHELRAMPVQSGERLVDIFHGEHDA